MNTLSDIQSRNVCELWQPKQLAELTIGIKKTVTDSFNWAKMRNTTRREVQRRFDICLRTAIHLRADLNWTTARICGALPNALAAELEGVKWEPDTRLCWIPSDTPIVLK